MTRAFVFWRFGLKEAVGDLDLVFERSIIGDVASLLSRSLLEEAPIRELIFRDLL